MTTEVERPGAAALRPRMTRWIAHVPTPRQQAALLVDWIPELLYGGAAGGGKSDYLLMAALQYIDVPGYSAIILRRTFPQLAQQDGLLERAAEWLVGRPGVRPHDSVSGLPTRYVWPWGATLTFRHCQHEKDRFSFQGAAYQYIGFDELTQFALRIYQYLKSRLRRPMDMHVPLRIRCGSNPGDEGHDWVKARFLTGEGLSAQEAAAPWPPRFLPARLSDNPFLDQEAYFATLSELPDYEREQLLEGNWDAQIPGRLMSRAWFRLHDPADTPELRRRVRRWDVAGTEAPRDQAGGPAWTAGVLMGIDASKEFWILDVARFRRGPEAVDNLIEATARADGREVAIREEQEPGSSGKAVVAARRKRLAGWDYDGIPSTGDKIIRARPFVTAASRSQIHLVRGPWIEDFLREVDTWPIGFMDQIDAAGGAYQDLTKGGLNATDLYGPPEKTADERAKEQPPA